MYPSNTLNILSCFKSFDLRHAKILVKQFSSIRRLGSYSLSFLFVCKVLPDQKIQDFFKKYVQNIEPNCHQKSHKVFFFSDSSFLGGELYESVLTYKNLYESNHSHSFGWLMQQIIKLYAPLKFQKNILIFDADSLPLNYLPTFDNSFLLPFYSERNDLYFELNSYLLGEFISKQHLGYTSYIAQHMFFDYKYMNLLAKTIANDSDSFSCQNKFILKICRIASSSSNLRLSEYELYGSFVQSLEYKAVERMNIRLARHGTVLRSLLGYTISKKVYEVLDCDVVAYELWSNTTTYLKYFV